MDQQPPLKELINYARTSECFKLGVELELDIVNLNRCGDNLSRMYNLWIQEKAETGTRRNLLSALRPTRSPIVSVYYCMSIILM